MSVQKLLAGAALALVLSAGAFAGVASHARAVATQAASHAATVAETEGVNGDRARVAETEGVNGDRARVADTESVNGDRARVA